MICDFCQTEYLTGDSDSTKPRRFCSSECQMDYEDKDLIDGVGFADPGGNSVLRAATYDNPRDRPCPTCGRQNVLTRIDVQRGYQCNNCADALEKGAP